MAHQHQLTFVCPSLRVGGAEKQWVLLLNELSSRYECAVYLTDGTGPLCTLLNDRVTIVNIQHASFARQIATITTRLKRGGIIVSRGMSAHLLCAIASLLAKSGWILNWHKPSELPLRNRHQLAMRLFSKIAVGAIAVAESQRAQLESFGFKDKIKIVSNGVSLPELRHTIDNSTEQQANVMLYTVCAMRPQKRLDILIRACDILRQRDYSVKVRLIGDGPSRLEWQALAQQLDLDVCFLGEQLDIEFLLSEPGIFVMTSETEAWPLALLEAMARGHVCVASRVGDVEKILAQGEAGVIVDELSPQAFASALEGVAQNPSRAATLAWNAREQIATQYGVSKMVEGYLAAFRAWRLLGDS